MKKICLLLGFSSLLLTACNGETKPETEAIMIEEAIFEDSLVGVYQHTSSTPEDTSDEEDLLELFSDGKYSHSISHYDDTLNEKPQVKQAATGYVLETKEDENFYYLDSSKGYQIETFIRPDVFQNEEEMMAGIESYTAEYLPYFDTEHEVASEYVHITMTAKEGTMDDEEDSPALEITDEGVLFENRLYKKQ